MPLAFRAAFARSNTRIRVFFTDSIVAGGTTASRYTLESLDAFGLPPTVAAAIAVPGQSDSVELVLDQPMVTGAAYRLTVAAGVTSISETAPLGTAEIFLGQTSHAASVSVPQVDVLAELFGEDILWSGTDWAENAEGDLDTISGEANAQGAVLRRLESDGLPWDPTYAPRARRFVDGPEGELATLVVELEQQAVLDDRVTFAEAGEPESASEDGSEQQIPITVRLLGGELKNLTPRVRLA